jgi:dipeptidyl aminopeptidase/acylaminoacyl peptidase
MKMISFDRIVWGIAAGLVLMIGSLAVLGNRGEIGPGVKINSVSPADGSNPSTTTEIQINFGEPMNDQSVQSNFVTQPALQGQIRWEGNTFIFKPDHPLFSHQTYTAILLSGAKNKTGIPTLRPLKWSFQPSLPSIVYLQSSQLNPEILHIISMDGNASRELQAAPAPILDFAPSPDGSQIALELLREDGRSELWLMDANTGKNQKLIGCAPSSCSNPVWSPDGKLLAFERNEPTPNHTTGSKRIWLYDLASGQSAPVFQDNQILGYYPTWSPDGKRLAFVDENEASIRATDLVTHAAFLIPSGVLTNAGSFSPDGSQLAYTKLVSVGSQFMLQLWLAHLDSNLSQTPLLINPETFQDSLPTWSPDGGWIAFLRRQPGPGQNAQVMLYNLSTTGLTQVTTETGYDNNNLVWDLTGQHLLIQRSKSNGASIIPQIWSYDLAAGRLTQVIDNALQGQWLP